MPVTTGHQRGCLNLWGPRQEVDTPGAGRGACSTRECDFVRSGGLDCRYAHLAPVAAEPWPAGSVPSPNGPA